MAELYRWEVSCLDLKTGETLWKSTAREGSPRIKKHRATNYASETPVTDGKRLYAYFGMNGVYCFDLNGTLLWEKDLGAHYTLNGWGTGSSPVLHQGRLFIQVDNEDKSFLVALDAKSGDELWKKDRDETTNYSTPFIWKNSQRTELVVGGKTTRSYDPVNGDLLWELKTDGYYTIPSPVADHDLLYLGNAARRNIPGTFFCIQPGAEGNITPAEGESTSSGVLWSDVDAPTSYPSPLLYEGLLYLLDVRGRELTCLDASTGEEVYQEKIDDVAACWASPWAHEDKIFFTDEKGVTTVLKAGREFQLLHRNILDDKVWASVAVSSDAYLIKGSDKIYCIAN
jgi:outer membrane protein assembly factor BamB